jgi:hypothetical protein
MKTGWKMVIRQMTAFDKAWGVAKNENSCSKCGGYIHFQDEPHWSAGVCRKCISKADFGEKFNRKLDSHKEGARGVPEKFSDLKPTTGEDHNRKVMADILETDNDGIEGEYERLKDMFDHEPQTGPSEDGVVANRGSRFNTPPDSSSQALGSKGLIERFKRAGPTPRGPVKKESDEDFLSSQSNFSINPDAMEGKSHAGNYVDDVRDLVEQGMHPFEAVEQVARIVGVSGKDLFRAYVEAYR